MPSAADPLPQVAVGAFVFKDDCVLLVKRGRPPAMGQWAIPGGRVKWGESLKTAAEREILEETGIAVTAGEPVYVFETIERDAAGRLAWHYVVVDLCARYDGGEVRPGDDALAARWISRAEFTHLDVNVRTREALRDRFAFP